MSESCGPHSGRGPPGIDGRGDVSRQSDGSDSDEDSLGQLATAAQQLLDNAVDANDQKFLVKGKSIKQAIVRAEEELSNKTEAYNASEQRLKDEQQKRASMEEEVRVLMAKIAESKRQEQSLQQERDAAKREKENCNNAVTEMKQELKGVRQKRDARKGKIASQFGGTVKAKETPLDVRQALQSDEEDDEVGQLPLVTSRTRVRGKSSPSKSPCNKKKPKHNDNLPHKSQSLLISQDLNANTEVGGAAEKPGTTETHAGEKGAEATEETGENVDHVAGAKGSATDEVPGDETVMDEEMNDAGKAIGGEVATKGSATSKAAMDEEPDGVGKQADDPDFGDGGGGDSVDGLADDIENKLGTEEKQDELVEETDKRRTDAPVLSGDGKKGAESPADSASQDDSEDDLKRNPLPKTHFPRGLEEYTDYFDVCNARHGFIKKRHLARGTTPKMGSLCIDKDGDTLLVIGHDGEDYFVQIYATTWNDVRIRDIQVVNESDIAYFADYSEAAAIPDSTEVWGKGYRITEKFQDGTESGIVVGHVRLPVSSGKGKRKRVKYVTDPVIVWQRGQIELAESERRDILLEHAVDDVDDDVDDATQKTPPETQDDEFEFDSDDLGLQGKPAARKRTATNNDPDRDGDSDEVSTSMGRSSKRSGTKERSSNLQKGAKEKRASESKEKKQASKMAPSNGSDDSGDEESAPMKTTTRRSMRSSSSSSKQAATKQPALDDDSDDDEAPTSKKTKEDGRSVQYSQPGGTEELKKNQRSIFKDPPSKSPVPRILLGAEGESAYFSLDTTSNVPGELTYNDEGIATVNATWANDCMYFDEQGNINRLDAHPRLRSILSKRQKLLPTHFAGIIAKLMEDLKYNVDSEKERVKFLERADYKTGQCPAFGYFLRERGSLSKPDGSLKPDDALWDYAGTKWMKALAPYAKQQIALMSPEKQNEYAQMWRPSLYQTGGPPPVEYKGNAANVVPNHGDIPVFKSGKAFPEECDQFAIVFLFLFDKGLLGDGIRNDAHAASVFALMMNIQYSAAANVFNMSKLTYSNKSQKLTETQVNRNLGTLALFLHRALVRLSVIKPGNKTITEKRKESWARSGTKRTASASARKAKVDTIINSAMPGVLEVLGIKREEFEALPSVEEVKEGVYNRFSSYGETDAIVQLVKLFDDGALLASLEGVKFLPVAAKILRCTEKRLKNHLDYNGGLGDLSETVYLHKREIGDNERGVFREHFVAMKKYRVRKMNEKKGSSDDGDERSIPSEEETSEEGEAEEKSSSEEE